MSTVWYIVLAVIVLLGGIVLGLSTPPGWYGPACLLCQVVTITLLAAIWRSDLRRSR